MIRAIQPVSIQQAFALIQDHMNAIEDDNSHLSRADREEMLREFAMAVHYIGRPDVVHFNRHFYRWIADKMFSDFPVLANYDADGNWIGD